jgi:lipopolysaccharide/colanic/teichoic acid biosynthesis glycosyltransferase
VGRHLGLAVKRSIDVVGAVVAIGVLSPVLASAAVAVAATQGRPIFFRHVRPGLHGERFTLIKFRTMRAPRPHEIWYETDERRVTRIGRLLRSMSIDELPQLWNVLRGEMSLVGPRPLLIEYVDRYTAEERRRHEMRPGITGWAVVNGRNVVRFEDRLRMDVWYVDHWSLALDLRILARTVWQVLRRTDVDPAQDIADIELPDRFRAGLDEALPFLDDGMVAHQLLPRAHSTPRVFRDRFDAGPNRPTRG